MLPCQHVVHPVLFTRLQGTAIVVSFSLLLIHLHALGLMDMHIIIVTDAHQQVTCSLHMQQKIKEFQIIKNHDGTKAHHCLQACIMEWGWSMWRWWKLPGLKLTPWGQRVTGMWMGSCWSTPPSRLLCTAGWCLCLRVGWRVEDMGLPAILYEGLCSRCGGVKACIFGSRNQEIAQTWHVSTGISCMVRQLDHQAVKHAGEGLRQRCTGSIEGA